ncbi:MAG TPA: DUF885 family protein [Rhizomicrobium sp.]|jgi:uncharacterized protein (DUF885 family)|nr:DUF885 family protein [Rhizomicrobium sp.]
MLDRRNLLATSAAAAIAAGIPRRVFAADAPGNTADTAEASKRLNALFDAFVSEQLDHAPEGATSLGIDTGARAHQRSELSDRSLAEAGRMKALVADQLKRLEAFNRASLSASDAVGYDVVMYGLKTQDAADRKYAYAGGNLQGPYVISQLTGSYQQLPDFLDSQHPIENKADADAYMARLDAFARVLDQESDFARHDVGLGVMPPDFVISRALGQMTGIRNTPVAQSVLVESVVRRTKEKNIAGNYGPDAEKIVSEKVYPALQRQIDYMTSLQPKAVHDAGVWRLPEGASYYADSLDQATTTTMKPADVHKLGLDVVARLSAQADTIMKAQGLTRGSVGQRYREMYNDPKFRYPNTDEGKEKLIANLNKKVQQVRARLPEYFGVLPKANVVIVRVPKYTEAGAPGGYYQNPSLDGSRPGRYYINLRDTAEVPSWTLPTLTYHEAIPGHHLQGSIQQEANLPLIRKITGFNAYVEGWALYSEQLAVEIGMYKDDPWGHLGQLHDAIFRGVRLVVDSGMHAMKWSREQAIKYYTGAIGDPEASATTEVERYCVWPGQACSYMVGKVTFLRLRDKAKKALGPRFDLRDFHDAVLLSGAVPLTVLENVVDEYIAAKRNGGGGMRSSRH